MTRLRKLVLDELQRRNYAQNTVRAYIHAIEDFAKYFHRSPDRLGPEHIREYQVHLFRDCKLSPGTIEGRTAALRFLFVKTLRRPYLPDHIPFPKRQRRMPTVLSQEEVARLIASAQNLMHRTMLMMLYATGLRRAELCHLKVCDIDSERMVIHVRQGKGGRDRDVLLTPKLLETLREYWRWMKPKTYLFPGTVNNWRADVPITEKIVWTAVAEAAKHAGRRASTCLRTRSGTVSLLTCSKPAPICARSRFCWVMPSSPTPLSTCTCPGVICKQFRVRWKPSRCLVPTR